MNPSFAKFTQLSCFDVFDHSSHISRWRNQTVDEGVIHYSSTRFFLIVSLID